MEWISVKDRLPDKKQKVCYKGNVWHYGAIFEKSEGICEYIKLKEDYYYFDTVDIDGDSQWTEVTHWMPLPKPPKDNK